MIHYYKKESSGQPYSLTCVASEWLSRDRRSWLGAGPLRASCRRVSARLYASPDTPRPSTVFICNISRSGLHGCNRSSKIIYNLSSKTQRNRTVTDGVECNAWSTKKSVEKMEMVFFETECCRSGYDFFLLMDSDP